MQDIDFGKKEILKHLSSIAGDESIAPNYRIKALELLGRAKGVFADEDEKVIGTVKIVDDIK